MTQSKSGNNQPITGGDRTAGEEEILARLDILETRLQSLANVFGEKVRADERRAEHSDTVLHSIQRDTAEVTGLLAQHRPALDRAAALIDPAAKLRQAFRPHRRETTARPTEGKDSK